MKWWLKTIIILIAVIVIAFLGMTVYTGYTATNVKRVPVEASPADLGLEYEDVSFKSLVDDLNLRGWFLPSGDSRAVVIMLHGGDMHRADPSINTLGIARGLFDHGFNVMMFDFRGHGESGGDRMSAGYYEQRDLRGAVEYLKRRGFERIGVLGLSMGAATALLTAPGCDDIDAVVSDSCYADLAGIMGREFKARTRFPEFFVKPTLFMIKVIFGVDFNAVKPVDSVADISPRPVLFIHGAGDTFIPLENVHRLYEASGNPENEMWIAPDADHVQAYQTNPEEYIDRVAIFFSEVFR
jgi:fermentation-respiration switch protein FrsA (DUF1100 family)